MKVDDLKNAREILIKYGVLIRFSDLELFHGRVNDDSLGEDWKVDPNFNNADNNTKNLNINKISSLSVGDYSVAKEFADARLKKEKNKGDNKDLSAKIYKIASTDKDAVIVNHNFRFDKLSDSEKQEVYQAIKVLKGFGISEAVPYKFEERQLHTFVADRAKKYLAQSGEGFFTKESIDFIYNELKKDVPPIRKELVFDVLSAYNTRTLIGMPKYLKYVIYEYVEASQRDTLNVGGYPINEKYVAAWLANNHIVGYSMSVDSATLRKRIDMCSLFDLEKINTEKAVGERYQQIMECFDGVTTMINDFELH